MIYFVYVLKSLKDGKRYTGISDNVKRRLKEHNRGNTRSTKNRTPFILEYTEKYQDRFSARKREKYFKSAAGRKWLNKYAEVAELADAYGSGPYG